MYLHFGGPAARPLMRPMHIIAVIPARYQSTRLPGKPLLNATGKYLVQHVYERARLARSVGRVIVATDDARIADAVRSFGGEAMLTSPDRASGTDRVAEVARHAPADAYINVQGDEPEIDPAMIDAVAELLREDPADVATLAVHCGDRERYLDPNTVKVVVDRAGHALYFSRSPLPGVKDRAAWMDSSEFGFLAHVGIYGYRRGFLLEITATPPTPLEKLESLEQLRALESGRTICVGIAEHETAGVDTPDDYRRFVERYRGNQG